MSNELQESLIQITKEVIVAGAIWGIITIAFILFLFKKDIKKWWRNIK